MASVLFYKYYCTCGEFLFVNSDIYSTSTLFSKYYIFIENRSDINIKIVGSNTATCETCYRPLGGVVHRQFNNQSDLIRFCGHLIHRRKVRLTIFSVIDENGVLIDGKFETKLIFGKAEVVKSMI